MSGDDLGTWLAAARQKLAAAGVDNARLDAALLAEAVTGLDSLRQRLETQRRLGDAETARLDRFLNRRLAGEPLSRILARREFWSLTFEVTPAVLDPRPDSETLIEAALACLPDADAPYALADLGTGSGCLLLSLLHERPEARGLGLDISAEALAVAAANARRLGLDARARFECGDWATWSGGPFDLIVANPPYIRRDEIATLAPDVHRYDPHLALDGGADGLTPYRLLSTRLADWLVPGGVAVLEHGHDQADAVARIFHDSPLTLSSCCRDLGGRDRAVVLQRPGRKELEM